MRLPCVPAAEQHDMRQHRGELVQPDAVAPAGFQRTHPLVTGEDGVEVREPNSASIARSVSR